MRKTPNVLFLMADEHQALALSCLGHDVVQTPNLDRLAERGTLFENAYTPSPICVPARAALATGQPVHQTGYWDNATAYDGRVPSWGHRLQAAGVPVTSIGKLHYRDDSDLTGFDRQILPMHIQHGIGQVWGSVRNPLPDHPHGGEMLGGIGAGLSKYNRYDMNVAEAAEGFLSERARDESPWAAFVSFVAPHFPLIAPQNYLDLYPAKDMPLPPVRPANGFPTHPWVARMNGIEDSDTQLGNDDRRREAIAAYYALCTFVDAQIGRVLDALEAAGLSDDTLVIYSSDHGEQLGMRGRWGKSTLYRESTQVPLIAAGPGFAPDRRVTTAVSLLDIAPTITAALGLSPDPDWTGRPLQDIAAAAPDPDRVVLSEYHAVMSPSAGFMLANGRWCYHHYIGYPAELFDLQRDPLQTRNLSGHPEFELVERSLRHILSDHCDPAEVDARAKADQDRLVARFGGPRAAYETGPSGATPVPEG
ncbi:MULTISPECIES: sulfatase-like hydrolase/transferase [Mameliella]|uniref:sulfatase-like hydrolase/transferase n=1 Tax=Mameliella TaxID=1434019 RepID=UPI000B52BBBE|nr:MULTISPECIES: sulfatase-like hydrolase/transferase [Mameliella]MCR9276202.1 sulfatase-like hydrolase/transferase [Paracoccaceae bacterium]OWV57344.1 sulfatase [Mameliella alba]